MSLLYVINISTHPQMCVIVTTYCSVTFAFSNTIGRQNWLHWASTCWRMQGCRQVFNSGGAGMLLSGYMPIFSRKIQCTAILD